MSTLRHLDRLAEQAQELGILRYQLLRFVNRASVLGNDGHVAEAIELTERGIVRAREVGWTAWETMHHGNAAGSLLEMGHWGEAQQHLTAMPSPAEVGMADINVCGNSRSNATR